MKLFYHKISWGNFGDDLNEWLWPRLIPDFEKSAAADWLVGIGTILDERLNRLEGTKLIIGSGYRPGKWNPVVKKDWKILFVRGPLTAERYGLEEGFALSDPALWVAEHWKREQKREQTGGEQVGFMPHYFTGREIDCEEACLRGGVKFINPGWDVERTLREIGSLDRVIVEAMHGAIVADALGIPWMRVKALSWRRESEQVADFKWTDWARSVGVEPEAKLVEKIPYWFGRGGRFINKMISKNQVGALTKLIGQAKNSPDFQLSDAGRRRELLERMNGRLRSVL